MKIVDKEARAGFPRMRGGRMRATVPISQDLLDRMLSKLRLNVKIEEHNRILISYGVVRAVADIVGRSIHIVVIANGAPGSCRLETRLAGLRASAGQPRLHPM
jgi:hypothetical protein